MAAPESTNAEFFGGLGCSNPEFFNPGILAIRRKVNFGETPVTASSNNEFLAIPACFVLTGVLCRELKKCGASTTIGVALKSDGTALKSGLSVGGTTLAYDFASSSKVCANGDMVYITPAAALSAGEFEVTILGYLPNFDSKDNIALAVPYKDTLQTAENVSGGDPYLAKLGK